MKLRSYIVTTAIALLTATSSFAQIANKRTETVKVFGNCEICKQAIEKAGDQKKLASVDWNDHTKMATITYDSLKTNVDEILKRIALAGYDNEKFLAPDDVYAKLGECCRYKRELHPVVKIKQASKDIDMGMNMGMNMAHGQQPQAGNEHSQHTGMNMAGGTPVKNNADLLQPLLDTYFGLKDGLVRSDAGLAATKAKALLAAIKNVDMNKLSTAQHNAWMKVMKTLEANAQAVSDSKDIDKQRKAFALLSENVYTLARVSRSDAPLYYQHCPMYSNGSNWLSKDSEIKNPYYGNKMLTCGSTIETLSVK